MPGISTHIAFSRLLLPQLGDVIEPYYFLLGTVAPDAFDRNESGSFQLYHFADTDGVSDLKRLQGIINGIRQHGGRSQISFADGYFAHLWLDNHARLHEDALEFNNPDGLAGNDLRKAVRACIEYHDLSIIGNFLKEVKSQTGSLTTVLGLEFISIEQTEKMLQKAMEMRQDSIPPTAGMIDSEMYREFLVAAAREFSRR